MKSIPIAFNVTLPAYTAVGGCVREGTASGLSAVLLSRGNRLSRRPLFEELEREGFDSVVAIEGQEERYDVEELSQAFPFVRFVLLREGANMGAQINIAAQETASPLFFVLWNDLHVIHGGGAPQMASIALEKDKDLASAGRSAKRLCTVPAIQNTAFETLPTLVRPLFQKRGVSTSLYSSSREASPSLYPVDGVGIYDRERFFRLGGFDGTIENQHWQLMDFGFRAWLWGEAINGTQFVRLTLDGEPSPPSPPTGNGYRRFYLKNLAPTVRVSPSLEGGEPEVLSHLPLRRFFPYLWSMNFEPLQAWREFSSARQWVDENRGSFKRDAASLPRIWESEL